KSVLAGVRHTNDLDPSPVPPDRFEALTDRVSTRPQHVSEMLVHDCHRARLLVVGVAEAPSTDDLDAHRLEVLPTDDVLPGVHALVAVDRLPLGLHCIDHADITHRNREREAHVLNAWNGPDTPIDIVE